MAFLTINTYSPTYFNTIISDPPSTNLSSNTFNQEFLLVFLLPALLGSYDIQFPSWSHPVWPLCIKARRLAHSLPGLSKLQLSVNRKDFLWSRRASP